MKKVLIIAMAALSVASFAQNAFYTGSLVSGGPTFNRPNANGTSAPTTFSTGAFLYNAQPFYVSVSGTYVMETAAPDPNAALDTYIAVYGTAFNPASPLTNCLIAEDDFSGAFTVLPGPYSGTVPSNGSGFSAPCPASRTTLALTAGTQYYMVNTSYSAGMVGTFYTGIGGGQGTVTLGAVPEPASMAVLGLGALALIRRRRKA